LPTHLAEKLYTIHRYENGPVTMNMVFRDHTISDLIGFVYSGMPPDEAAQHLIQNIKRAAQPVLDMGRDAVVSIILDGDNACEYYPRSGREFLRRFYEALQNTPGMEAVTISEAIARHQSFNALHLITPGSWISANFNVWIGAPEDNRSWDYLYQARTFYEGHREQANEAQRKLAYEELLIAEGSDWNWWYGPEHHSANDRDFDELYRKHLSNVYQALGATPPDYLAQPISGVVARPSFIRQTAYIHPRVAGDMVRYFEWMGAATYTADHRAGAMHGKQFLFDAVHAGIDETYVYGRLDFKGKISSTPFELVVNLESWEPHGQKPMRGLRLEVVVDGGKVLNWKVTDADGIALQQSSDQPANVSAKIALLRNFEFRIPLAWLDAVLKPGRPGTSSAGPRLRLRLSLWQNRLPVDALPLEGWIELHVMDEAELLSM
jgi:hypothetical protein